MAADAVRVLVQSRWAAPFETHKGLAATVADIVQDFAAHVGTWHPNAYTVYVGDDVAARQVLNSYLCAQTQSACCERTFAAVEELKLLVRASNLSFFLSFGFW